MSAGTARARPYRFERRLPLLLVPVALEMPKHEAPGLRLGTLSSGAAAAVCVGLLLLGQGRVR